MIPALLSFPLLSARALRIDVWRWQHLWLPLFVGTVAVLLAHLTAWDHRVSAYFYDGLQARWTYGQSYWADTLLYHAGKRLIAAVALSSLTAWAASFVWPQLCDWRRPASYLLLCMALSTGLVSLGKRSTGIDCPRDLAAYGGPRAEVGWFEARPVHQPAGRCFPGGHSSGGFSLLALYFLLIERRPRAARMALTGTLLLGGGFALAQWARGSHAPSHDLASATLAWTVAASVYTVAYRRRLWSVRPDRPEHMSHASAAD